MIIINLWPLDVSITMLSLFSREERNTEQECRLVDDITAPGGIKAAPPRDSLNSFISRLALESTLSKKSISSFWGVFSGAKYWTVWQL